MVHKDILQMGIIHVLNDLQEYEICCSFLRRL